jgi:hypothetical protein
MTTGRYPDAPVNRVTSTQVVPPFVETYTYPRSKFVSREYRVQNDSFASVAPSKLNGTDTIEASRELAYELNGLSDHERDGEWPYSEVMPQGAVAVHREPPDSISSKKISTPAAVVASADDSAVLPASSFAVSAKLYAVPGRSPVIVAVWVVP